MKHQIKTFAAAGIMAVSSACAVSRQQAAQLGAEQAAQLDQQLPIIRNASADQYVEQLGQRIVNNTPYAGQDFKFSLYRSDEVNAFALPGGFIYVSTGLVRAADNISELAGVLAHEIAHVTLGHSAEQMSRAQNANLGAGLLCVFTSVCQSGAGRAAINVGGTAYLAKFSRAAEREADLTAIQYVTASGIHPQGLVTMFEELARMAKSNPSALESWFSSHPQAEDRAQYVQARISQVPSSSLNRLTLTDSSYPQFQRLVASAR
jgi:predicted Zn-dependent protease